MRYITEDPIIIFLLSVFLILIVSFIIIFIIFYQKRQVTHFFEIKTMQQDFENNLLQSRIETQDETLSQLSKELHDNVGQLLNSAKLLIGITQRKLKEPPDTLTVANETLGTAINEMRSLSKSLNKEWLQQFNFIENLETEIKRINASQVLQITFLYDDHLPLQTDAQIILFRIVQEALQNAIKHSGAKNINIVLEEKDDSCFVTLTDDGKGFEDAAKQASGIGIMNMQHRTKLLGGTIEWLSSNKGTTIKIQLPVKKDQND
ncbi:MAG: hypothetical protein KGL19_07475 [Bacteroidota bacterium]|nr:hypothetical protein [Bacteroidota bacterium]